VEKKTIKNEQDLKAFLKDLHQKVTGKKEVTNETIKKAIEEAIGEPIDGFILAIAKKETTTVALEGDSNALCNAFERTMDSVSKNAPHVLDAVLLKKLTEQDDNE
jgi:hypothetical protein